MKEDVITKVINAMVEILDTEQLMKLKDQLFIALSGYDVIEKKNEIIQYDSSDLVLLQKFIDAKIAAGKSLGTAKLYRTQLRLALLNIGKPIVDIDEDDIRMFLYKYQVRRGNTNSTVRNMRAYLSSFFNWLRKNRYIMENPMDLVEPIKTDYTIKQPFTDEDIVKIKDACDNKRDRALVDFLDASMIRVGELQHLNREDIVFTDRECIVYGKGKKERVAYFNGEAKIHLQEYLAARTDDNPALFVGKNRPYNRMSIAGIQETLKRVGKKAGIYKVHPHRFRRTGATRCLSAGMPVEELQVIMGHTDIKTTLLYARIDQKRVKFKYNSICSW